MTELLAQLQAIFRDVFGDPQLEITEEMSAADVEGWDSVTHVDLIIAVERALGVKFAMAEMSRLKEPDQNIGSFVRMIASKRHAD